MEDFDLVGDQVIEPVGAEKQIQQRQFSCVTYFVSFRMRENVLRLFAVPAALQFQTLIYELSHVYFFWSKTFVSVRPPVHAHV